jgi:hypothetical protein
MLAAALTVWILFSIWLLAPLLHLPAGIARVAAALLAAEFAALLLYSYGSSGCTDPTCAPVAQAFGIAARTDIPVLAAVFVAFTTWQAARSLRTHGPSIEADGRLASADHPRQRAG